LSQLARRDFLNGVALTVGGALLSPRDAFGFGLDDPARGRASYPPSLTGLRGSHAGSFEVAHALRDGSFWATAGAPSDTGESYDLVVVGAGISGLAAAWYFRQAAGPSARILILDNHDDFGGHARRNEFRVGGRTLIGYGGTFAIDSPAPYSAAASALVAELGVEVSRWPRMFERGLYRGLGMSAAIFFDRETFGVDRLVQAPAGIAEPGGATSGPGQPDPLAAFLAGAPLSELAGRDIGRLFKSPVDYLPGLDDRTKKARLARMSYADFLLLSAGCHPDVLPLFQARPHSLYGLGIDAVSALDAWGLGLPGFIGMNLESTAGPGMGLAARPGPRSPFLHFPDGNATIARLLVQRLIPRAVPGRGADDVAVARVDYARLDRPGPARLRLESTVVRARQASEAARVEVDYVRSGRLQRVRARNCVLACWSSVIPLLCPELPEAQREALAYATKVPIVYTNVVLRSWRSFHALPGQPGPLSGQLPHVGRPGSSCARGKLSAAAPARRADRRADDAHAVPAWTPGARAAPSRPSGAVHDDVRHLRAQRARAAHAHAGGGGLRRDAGHPGPHREPLAAWLRLPVQLALGSVLDRRRAVAVRGRATAVRPHRHRQCGCRGVRLHGRGDRSGPPRGRRAGTPHVISAGVG